MYEYVNQLVPKIYIFATLTTQKKINTQRKLSQIIFESLVT